MAAGKIKASKFKVHQPPDGAGGRDGPFHVYTFDVFNRTFLSGRSFDTVEKAVAFQRHEQERIYAEQEADPELFDLPFVSSDSDLLSRVQREPSYRARLIQELGAEARARARADRRRCPRPGSWDRCGPARSRAAHRIPAGIRGHAHGRWRRCGPAPPRAGA